MNTVTCVVHGGEVDEREAVELPTGYVCNQCYLWMEELLEEEEDLDDLFSIEFEIDDDDD